MYKYTVNTVHAEVVYYPPPGVALGLHQGLVTKMRNADLH